MPDRTPTLIIISGPPGAGKSTLARPLARHLGMPLFEKDAIKERFADDLGSIALSMNSQLGLAAILELYATTREMIHAGRDVVIESFFHHGRAETDLVPIVADARALLIHIYADTPILLSRYERRLHDPARHPIHEVGNRIGDLRHYLAEGICDPLDLDIPRIFIDTTYGDIDAEEVAHMTRETLGIP